MKRLKRLLFFFWMHVAHRAVRGMGKNSEMHKRTSVANRITHTIRAGQQEFVFTWADLTKPSGLSREEIVVMEQMLAEQQGSGRTGWPSAGQSDNLKKMR